MIQTRPATVEDMAAIADIYNHYILNTTITFETEADSESNRREWFQQFSVDGPHQLFVTQEAGTIQGFAASVRFHERAAYHTSVMTSVYLRDGQTGRGLGHQLYTTLIEAMDAQASLHRAYALISLPNEASLKLHAKFGFTETGVLEEAGQKFGRYLSVQILQRPIPR